MDFEMAQQLANRRKEAKLSQEALAEKLGVSRQAVSKWERGESSPDTDNIIALAKLYDITIDELLYGNLSEEKTAVPDNEPAKQKGSKEDIFSESSFKNSSSESSSEPRKPHVHISLCDGVHVVDPDKGEEVHVGWNGVHVDDDKKGEHVHIDFSGIHIDTPENGKKSFHKNIDGTFTVDDKTYANWHEVKKAEPWIRGNGSWNGEKPKTTFGRAWAKFPYPLLVILAYLALGIFLNEWGLGLFIFFTVPAYYLIGAGIDSRQLGPAISGLYGTGALAWFCYQAFVLGQPHPAWAILLTIPVVVCFAHWCTNRWTSRKNRTS